MIRQRGDEADDAMGQDVDIGGQSRDRSVRVAGYMQPPESLPMPRLHRRGIRSARSVKRVGKCGIQTGIHTYPLWTIINYFQTDKNEIPGLLAAYSEAWARLPKTPAHILLAHHRFAWIHPFLDGNGRVARLLSTAMLARHGFDAGGLWSLSRGLAKRRDRYYEHLALADAPRQGDYDGRGALSLKAATELADFMLDTCEDQIRFMTARLQIEHMKDRAQRFCAERKLVLGRDERAAPLLVEAIFMAAPPRACSGLANVLRARSWPSASRTACSPRPARAPT
jgi:hypothetical protein